MKRQAKPQLQHRPGRDPSRRPKRDRVRQLATGGALVLALCMLTACNDRHEPVKPTVQHSASVPAQF